MKDGLSQADRQQRIHSVKPFTVIDNSMQSLLCQAKAIAGFIRYYSLDGKQKGHFDQLLTEINNLTTLIEKGKSFSPNGDMEPAQALLYTFLHQLHQITRQFNERWNRYASWYIQNVLKISPKKPCSDSTWIALTKNLPENIRIPKGTSFSFNEAKGEDRLRYRTSESITVTDASIEKVYSLLFEKNPDVYPACIFGIPTALKMKEILHNHPTSETRSIGLQLSSPSLLLREGKRFITISFQTERNQSENQNIIFNLIKNAKQSLGAVSAADAKEIILLKVFSDIFYLEISTPEGWKAIDKYTIKRGSRSSNGNRERLLILKFELPEDFPETIACNQETHEITSIFPTLRIFLNHDAWLFPYIWLKDFLIKRIILKAEVEGINNILFYNELGKIDNAVPFAPFGINTERGAWFTLGNYEMAIKNVQSADVHIQWQQLPTDDGGLSSYYSGYRNNIDNCSFKLTPRYLSDYRWKKTGNTHPVFLFSTHVKDKQGNPEPQSKLSEDTVLSTILLEDMKPVSLLEEKYDYSIHSKTGFFSFIMEEPEMGFGEKQYRQLFSENMIKRALRKKKIGLLNPPITPLIERVSLSYTSLDEIDFRSQTVDESASVAHIYSFGKKTIYPSRENKPMPFVFSLDTDKNILFALKGVKGDEMIHIYFDFFPQEKSIALSEIPRIRWYWGDGYQWQILPDDSMRRNTTQNLLVDGGIKIYIPEITGQGFRDEDGLVWLRAGITQNENNVSEINALYTNAIQVVRDLDQMDRDTIPGFLLNTPEENLPGITKVQQIAPYSDGQRVEDEFSKLIRVSEFISHRGRAVTTRDFERMTLEAFPEVGKVKCLPNFDTKASDQGTERQQGVVTLVIISTDERKLKENIPYASTELLLKIEKYFADRISACINRLDAINPVYEEVLVRCKIEFHLSNLSNASARSIIRKAINQTIAPWQKDSKTPCFGFSFQIKEMKEKIEKISFVKEVKEISVIQMYRAHVKNGYQFKEYIDFEKIIAPTRSYAILIPAQKHIIASELIGQFGIEEMDINENFVIWQDEIEKR